MSIVTELMVAASDLLRQPVGAIGVGCVLAAIVLLSSERLQAPLPIGPLTTSRLVNLLNLVGGLSLLVHAVLRAEVVWLVLETVFVALAGQSLVRSFRPGPATDDSAELAAAVAEAAADSGWRPPTFAPPSADLGGAPVELDPTLSADPSVPASTLLAPEPAMHSSATALANAAVPMVGNGASPATSAEIHPEPIAAPDVSADRDLPGLLAVTTLAPGSAGATAQPQPNGAAVEPAIGPDPTEPAPTVLAAGADGRA